MAETAKTDPLSDPVLDRVARESQEAIQRARAMVADIHQIDLTEEMILEGIRAARKRMAERGGFEPPVEL